MISQYRTTSKTNQSKVICCFDCDDYDSKQEDLKFLEDAEKFCKDKGYEFVWFCKDVEQVYIGKRVADMQKKKKRQTSKLKSGLRRLSLRILQQ
ncbi:MAG: hypothetical protein ACLR6B_17700 [Blautia sp.]